MVCVAQQFEVERLVWKILGFQTPGWPRAGLLLEVVQSWSYLSGWESWGKNGRKNGRKTSVTMKKINEIYLVFKELHKSNS